MAMNPEQRPDVPLPPSPDDPDGPHGAHGAHDPHGGPDGLDGSEADERLACGRLLSDVWARWDDRADDPHAATCPHCTAALNDLRALDAAVHAQPTGPEPDVSNLAARVMEVVRMELRPGRTLPLGDLDEDLWIVEAAVARELRAAAEDVPGVRAGSCRVSPPTGAPRPGSPQSGARGPVTVSLDIAVPPVPDLQGVAAEVRSRVTRAADTALGLALAQVDVTVVDILDQTDERG